MIGAFSDFFSSDFNTVGKEVSQSFPVGKLFRHGDDGLVITPSQFNTVGVFFSDKAVLIALNSKGDGCPCRDGVKPVAVTNIAGHDD